MSVVIPSLQLVSGFLWSTTTTSHDLLTQVVETWRPTKIWAQQRWDPDCTKSPAAVWCNCPAKQILTLNRFRLWHVLVLFLGLSKIITFLDSFRVIALSVTATEPFSLLMAAFLWLFHSGTLLTGCHTCFSYSSLRLFCFMFLLLIFLAAFIWHPRETKWCVAKIYIVLGGQVL